MFVRGETKSLPGRDAPVDGSARGRCLAAAWFEKVDVSVAGLIVTPVEGQGEELKLELRTVADISREAGYNPPTKQALTAREMEVVHEERLLDHGVIRYNSERCEGEGSSWCFILKDRTTVIDFCLSRSCWFYDG